jgi:hypothetical protein
MFSPGYLLPLVLGLLAVLIRISSTRIVSIVTFFGLILGGSGFSV